MIALNVIGSFPVEFEPEIIIICMACLLGVLLLLSKVLFFLNPKGKVSNIDDSTENPLYSTPDVLMQSKEFLIFNYSSISNTNPKSIWFKTLAIILGVILCFINFEDLLRPF